MLTDFQVLKPKNRPTNSGSRIFVVHDGLGQLGAMFLGAVRTAVGTVVRTLSLPSANSRLDKCAARRYFVRAMITGNTLCANDLHRAESG